MTTEVVLLRDTATPAVLAASAIEAVAEGMIDPLTAYGNVARMEKAIEIFKANERVKESVMNAIDRYGRKVEIADTTMEVVEGGVRYDYAACGDSRLEELYSMRQALDKEIKMREAFLKGIPSSGVADVETGEVVYPPARKSKTTIKTTIR